MKPTIAILDGFFLFPETVLMVLAATPHGSVTSPVDNVTYHGINEDIPSWMSHEFKRKIERILDAKIHIRMLFSRLNSVNTPITKNIVHCDSAEGQYSAHVYLSKNWPECSGTGFFAHKATRTSGHSKQLTSEQMEQIKADANDLSAWQPSFMCQAAFNRILIKSSSLWHAALPVEGFGNDLNTGRLVLTAFFDLENK